MKLTTIEPKRTPTKVIIEMTDSEACELRDEMSLDEAHAIGEKTLKLMELIHELTSEW